MTATTKTPKNVKNIHTELGDVDSIVRTALDLAAARNKAKATVVLGQATPELLRAARVQLLDGLRVNPFFDPTGILATRYVTAAIDSVPADEADDDVAQAA